MSTVTTVNKTYLLVYDSNLISLSRDLHNYALRVYRLVVSEKTADSADTLLNYLISLIKNLENCLNTLQTRCRHSVDRPTIDGR